MAWGLQLSGLLLGAAGMAHCAAMCTLPCAMAARACAPGASSSSAPWEQAALHAGRLTGYMLLGAAAAASVGFLRGYFDQVSGLRPLWLLMQVALLLCGLTALAMGRVPGLARLSMLAVKPPSRPGTAAHGSRRWPGAALAYPAGLAWALLPCAQLYAGVALASMADGAADAAGVMLAFGLPGTVAVVAGPGAWRLLRRLFASKTPHGPGDAQLVRIAAKPALSGLPVSSWSVRLAGASTALAAGWLLLHSAKPGAAWWCG